MLQRWIEENKRFLAGVVGAAVLLAFFFWMFVTGTRNSHRAAVKQAGGSAASLKKLYRPKGAKDEPKPDQPLGRTLKKVKQLRDEFGDALKTEIGLYGNAPAGAFILPGDQAGSMAPNYYDTQRAAVVEALEAAAAANAVNVKDAEFGLPSGAPSGKDAETTVRKLLWQAQIVRRVVAAAIAAGVDSIEDVQLTSNLTERSHSDGGYRIYGIPLRVVVTGPAGQCAVWLQSLQDTSQGYVVIVAAKTARDGDILGNVEMTIDLMGLQHEKVQAAEDDGEDG